MKTIAKITIRAMILYTDGGSEILELPVDGVRVLASGKFATESRYTITGPIDLETYQGPVHGANSLMSRLEL